MESIAADTHADTLTAAQTLIQLSQGVVVKKITEASTLKRKREPSRKKPKYYKCTECNIKKADRLNIEYHCTIHLDKTLKPFSCTICSNYKSFTRANIHKHFIRKHPQLINKKDNFITTNYSNKNTVDGLVSKLYHPYQYSCITSHS